MDFSFTEDQELFRKTIRDFAEKYIAPRADEIEEKKRIPEDIINEMAKMGLLGLTISPDYGGMGADPILATIATEEIARADLSVATAVYYLLNAGWPVILERHGTKEAKEEVLPKVAKGEYFFGIASTESGGGSDVANIKTTMVRKNGKLIVNGEKMYISGVREVLERGGGFVTPVKTDPSLGHRGITTIYFPLKGVKGITPTYVEDMGREGLSTGGFSIEDVEIPEHYIIGEWNKGFYYVMEGFNYARILVSAACIGAAEKVLEIGMEYIKQRTAFGRPIGKFEGIQFQLADDYTKLEMMKFLVHRAAWMLKEHYEKNRFTVSELNKAIAMAKLYAPPTSVDIIRDVMIWHGAYGYTKEGKIERALRGVFSYAIGAEGAVNIMRIILGRELLGKEFIPYK